MHDPLPNSAYYSHIRRASSKNRGRPKGAARSFSRLLFRPALKHGFAAQRPWAQDGAGTGPSGPRPRHGRCHAGASGRQIRQRMRQRQQSRLTCAAQYRKARFICSQHMQIGRQCRQIPGVSRAASPAQAAQTRRRISFCPHGLHQLVQRACALNGGGEPVLQALGRAPHGAETRRIRQPLGGTTPQYRTRARPERRPRPRPAYTAAGRLAAHAARAAAPPARTSARSAEAEAYRPGAASSGASWAAPRRGSARGTSALFGSGALRYSRPGCHWARAALPRLLPDTALPPPPRGGGERFQAASALPAQLEQSPGFLQQRTRFGRYPPAAVSLCRNTEHPQPAHSAAPPAAAKALGGQRSVGCRQAGRQVRPAASAAGVRTRAGNSAAVPRCTTPGLHTHTTASKPRFFSSAICQACPLWKGLYSAMIPAVLMAASLLSAAVHA